MRIRFWGTRGSLPKPGPTTLRYGGNTSCVEVRTPGGRVPGARLRHRRPGARPGPDGGAQACPRPPVHRPHPLGPHPGAAVLHARCSSPATSGTSTPPRAWAVSSSRRSPGRCSTPTSPFPWSRWAPPCATTSCSSRRCRWETLSSPAATSTTPRSRWATGSKWEGPHSPTSPTTSPMAAPRPAGAPRPRAGTTPRTAGTSTSSAEWTCWCTTRSTPPPSTRTRSAGGTARWSTWWTSPATPE